MAHINEDLLFFIIFVILVVFIVEATLFLHKYFSGFISLIVNLIKNRWLNKLLSKKDYKQISEKYHGLANKEKRRFERDNLLGMAALYEHDSKTAIDLFKISLKEAPRGHVRAIEDNLATAYLQDGLHITALNLFEVHYENGGVKVIAYILALLMNDREGEANTFYEYNRNMLDNQEKHFMELILSFSLSRTEIIEELEKIIKADELWIYQPVLKRIVLKWELLVFYNSTERHNILLTQGKKLLSEFQKQPELFNNENVKYMRSLISKIIQRINTYDDVARLWGIIDGIDELALKLPLDNKLCEECYLFWNRIYFLFSKTSNIETYDFEKEQKFIKEQMPLDAKSTIDCTHRCDLFLNDSLHFAIRLVEIYKYDFSYYYLDIVSEELAKEILTYANPISEIIKEVPSTEEFLEPLLYDLVCSIDSVKASDVIDALNRISPEYREKLQPLRERVLL